MYRRYHDPSAMNVRLLLLLFGAAAVQRSGARSFVCLFFFFFTSFFFTEFSMRYVTEFFHRLLSRFLFQDTADLPNFLAISFEFPLFELIFTFSGAVSKTISTKF